MRLARTRPVWEDGSLQRDPAEDGLNWYAFVRNSPVNGIDILGLANFQMGGINTRITHDRGAGEYNSEIPTPMDVLAKGVVTAGIEYARRYRGWKEAADHLEHFLGGSGSPIFINFNKLMTEVSDEQSAMYQEIDDAKEWIRQQDKIATSDRHFFFYSESSRPNLYIERSESENWYYAIGGYSAWGSGEVRRCGVKYLVKFTYHMEDRYNWDGGKQTEFTCPNNVPCGIVPIEGWSYDESSNQVTITDEFLAKLHRTGLAQEFNVYGSVHKFLVWEGDGPVEIRDGWPENDAWPGLYD